jgi:hypothetical protein
MSIAEPNDDRSLEVPDDPPFDGTNGVHDFAAWPTLIRVATENIIWRPAYFLQADHRGLDSAGQGVSPECGQQVVFLVATRLGLAAPTFVNKRRVWLPGRFTYDGIRSFSWTDGRVRIVDESIGPR